MVSCRGRTDPHSQGLAPDAVTHLVRRRPAASAPQDALRCQSTQKTSLQIARETTRERPSTASRKCARTRPRAYHKICPRSAMSSLDLGRSRRGDVPMGWRHTPGLTPKVFLCQSSLRICTRPSGRFSARCRLDGTPPSPVHHMPRRNAGLQDCWMTRRGSVQEGVCRDAPSGRARYTSIFLGLLIGS